MLVAFLLCLAWPGPASTIPELYGYHHQHHPRVDSALCNVVSLRSWPVQKGLFTTFARRQLTTTTAAPASKNAPHVEPVSPVLSLLGYSSKKDLYDQDDPSGILQVTKLIDMQTCYSR